MGALVNESAPSRSAPRPWPRRLLNRLEIDQAVFFAIAARGWQFLAGPLTVILIGKFFSAEVQGYYYTFWSLIALQTVFDFSFHPVIVNFASHEWGAGGHALARHAGAGAALDGDSASQPHRLATERLASLLRGSLVGYAIVAVAFLLVVGGSGLAFFALGQASDALAWRAPWLALVALTALTFWTTPWLAMLEGCDEVKSVYHLQFTRAVVGNLVVWALIPLGAALWVPAAAAAVRLVCEAVWIVTKHREFFSTLLRQPRGARVDWWGEVWPFQWRVGLRGLLGFANTFLINPVVFLYHGEVAAGQLGMTWQILTSLQAACMSWLKTKTAKLGMLVSSGQFAELDRIYFRLLWISGTFLALGCAAFVLLVFGLNQFDWSLAGRMLPTLPTAVLAVAIVLLIIPESQWTYIHAHKKSPHLGLAVLGAVLSAVLIVKLGHDWGASGVIVAYFTMIVAFYLPLWSAVWWSCRARWHAEPEPLQVDRETP